MTASDKKKVTILVGLIIVAVISWYYVYSPASATGPDATAKAPAKTAVAKPGQTAQIRLDIIDAKPTEVGQKNLFLYGMKPVPKPVEPPRPNFAQIPNTSVPINPNPPPPIQQVQPFKSFRYEGFSVSKGGGKILGSITEGANTYEVKEGDCVMGQYCITRLTEALVEIEDLQLKRRQSFTRTQ